MYLCTYLVLNLFKTNILYNNKSIHVIIAMSTKTQYVMLIIFRACTSSEEAKEMYLCTWAHHMNHMVTMATAFIGNKQLNTGSACSAMLNYAFNTNVQVCFRSV